jgi:hypothetical protein
MKFFGIFGLFIALLGVLTSEASKAQQQFSTKELPVLTTGKGKHSHHHHHHHHGHRHHSGKGKLSNLKKKPIKPQRTITKKSSTYIPAEPKGKSTSLSFALPQESKGKSAPLLSPSTSKGF